MAELATGPAEGQPLQNDLVGPPACRCGWVASPLLRACARAAAGEWRRAVESRAAVSGARGCGPEVQDTARSTKMPDLWAPKTQLAAAGHLNAVDAAAVYVVADVWSSRVAFASSIAAVGADVDAA